MKKLLKIAALSCMVAGTTFSHASKLILEFQEVDCKEDTLLLECQSKTFSAREIATMYGKAAYILEDPYSIYNLARFTYNEVKKGSLAAADGQTILGLLEAAADMGYGPAQLTYAKYLQSPQVDHEAWALHFFLRAHENGMTQGTLAAALIFHKWGWYKDAFPLMEQAAKSGNRDAQYLTGMMLAQGQKDVKGGFWSDLASLCDFGKSARMRAARPEAIRWLQHAKKQKHPHAKAALLELFEADDREGKATFTQLMALGDACDISKTSSYDSKNRWDAITYYQRAARLAAENLDTKWEAEARFQAGVALNTPYLEGEGVHFRWVKYTESARPHFIIAESLGHERAKMCLEEMAQERCLDILLPENQHPYAVQQMCGFFPAGWNPAQALEAIGGYPLPMGPQIDIQ